MLILRSEKLAGFPNLIIHYVKASDETYAILIPNGVSSPQLAAFPSDTEVIV
jgi:hypothetical protein